MDWSHYAGDSNLGIRSKGVCAARLPHFSAGGELILFGEIRSDPEVSEFLERNATPNSVSRFQGEIRGYDPVVEMWRVRI